jgi:hypothetical protein
MYSVLLDWRWKWRLRGVSVLPLSLSVASNWILFSSLDVAEVHCIDLPVLGKIPSF